MLRDIAYAAFVNTTFADNVSANGGAVYIDLQTAPVVAADTGEHRMQFEGCTFKTNAADGGAGGAILEYNSSPALSAAVDAATQFVDNAAQCCYAGGHLTGLGGCQDVSTGFQSSWCVCFTKPLQRWYCTSGTVPSLLTLIPCADVRVIIIDKPVFLL